MSVGALFKRKNVQKDIQVNKEVKMAEEISTKDGSFHIGHDENPAKGATES